MKHIGLSLLTAAWWLCLSSPLFAQAGTGDVYPDWQAGYLDIHHINTGRGECMFAILPDGTTLMVDAGETGTDTRNFKPDGSRSAGAIPRFRDPEYSCQRCDLDRHTQQYP